MSRHGFIVLDSDSENVSKVYDSMAEAVADLTYDISYKWSMDATITEVLVNN